MSTNNDKDTSSAASQVASAVQAPIQSLNQWGKSMTPEGGFNPVQDIKDVRNREWNTKNMTQRLGIDLASAAAAGGAVAPVVSMIDRGIIESASDKTTLRASIQSSLRTLLTRPHIYLTSKQFGLIFLLYSSTYLSANLLDTFTSTVKNRPATHVTSGTTKFLATSTTNLSICLYKDSQFARLFGAASSSNRGIPPITYAIFAARDAMTVFASFNLPPVIAPMLPMKEGNARTSTAQFIAPAGMQLLTTPLHLLGLDFHNRQAAGAWSRAYKVAADYAMASLGRIARILPAFGVGGVVNTNVRRSGMDKLV